MASFEPVLYIDLSVSRKHFEDTVFNKHFMSTIRVAPPGTPGFALQIDPDKSLTKHSLCKRDSKGYVRPEISAMWFGWLSSLVSLRCIRKEQLKLELTQGATYNLHEDTPDEPGWYPTALATNDKDSLLTFDQYRYWNGEAFSEWVSTEDIYQDMDQLESHLKEPRYSQAWIKKGQSYIYWTYDPVPQALLDAYAALRNQDD